MKTKILPACLLIWIIAMPLSAQPVQVTVDLTPSHVYQYLKNMTTGQHIPAPQDREIGREILWGEALVYRSYYLFDLSDIAHAHQVVINSVRVIYSTANTGSHTFKLTGPSSITDHGSAEINWNAIGNAGVKESGIVYKSSNNILSSGMKTYLESQLSGNTLIVGALSESEATTGSFSSLQLTLRVTYTYQPYMVTIRNDFGGYYGGLVGVGKNTAPLSRNSPFDLAVINGDMINMAAYDNQNFNGYQWVFNDTEAATTRSEWRRLHNNTNIFLSYNQSISRTVNHDQNAIFSNLQRRLYNVSHQEQTEFGAYAGTTYEAVVEGNPRTITAPASKTINGKYLAFAGWMDNPNAPRTRPVTPNDHTTYTAQYKGLGISNDATAFANNSQRRLVQTRAGGNPDWLHRVYSSMGHVWIEHSGDGGSTWTLGNEGKPLDGGAGGKNPAIAHAYDFPFNVNYIGVVWQQPHGSTWQIMGKMFTQFGNTSAAPGYGTWPAVLHTEPSDPWSVDANPSLALVDYAFGPYFVTFERKSAGGGLQPGIRWLAGSIEDIGSQLAGPFGYVAKQGTIVGTNAASTRVQLSQYPEESSVSVNFLWQQGTPSGAIRSYYIHLSRQGDSWSEPYVFDDGTISYIGNIHTSPSIVTLPDYYYAACWVEYANDLVFYSLHYAVRYYYGSGVESCSVARGRAGSINSGFAVWSQKPGSSWQNRSIRFDNGVPAGGSIATLSTTGRFIQAGNSASNNLSRMYATAFYPASSPYTFATSGTLGPTAKQNPDAGIVESRGLELRVGETAFRYRFGELNVDGRDIPFVAAPDDADYADPDVLNAALLTEPFAVQAGSKIVFAEQAGFSDADTEAAARALGPEGYIRYKVELVDQAGRAIGTVRQGQADASSARLLPEQASSFALSAEGLSGRTVRARITFETNLAVGRPASAAIPADLPEDLSERLRARAEARRSNLVLIKRYSEANEAVQRAASAGLIRMEEPEAPAVSALHPAYPNPFNPSTVIRFELPTSGPTHLAVYDVLGREVAVLVDGEVAAGRHQVRFDAASLSSGVYIVRMRAGSFVDSRKVVLMK